MFLAISLTESQIVAASALQAQMSGWTITDRALTALGERFPESNREAVLLKVAAVNQLYGTYVYAVTRMAEHVAAVLKSADTATGGDTLADVALIERLAALPKAPAQQSERKHVSFASKFAHFFIDRERFPIYDSYAEQMAAYHLGPKGRITDLAHPYWAFVLNLHALRERAGLSCSAAELDRYLWLAGLYRAWQRNPKAQINAEVAQLFASPPHAAAAQLAALLPASLASAMPNGA
ncbi:MAG TPA: hypothetical protein VLA19_24105 [Herpetosiphonaceae bacterium]|nr:hypothetical protein [Herpetosiphonaceae bacterium]